MVSYISPMATRLCNTNCLGTRELRGLDVTLIISEQGGGDRYWEGTMEGRGLLDVRRGPAAQPGRLGV